MDPLATVDRWPVQRVAAAVIVAGETHATRGDLDEIFHLASVTKLLTAMATLVAHEEGSVDLDATATDHGATVADLLAHAGGLDPDSRSQLTAPRSRRIYSTSAYDLVAELVAEAAAMPFAEYVQAAVCEPLGMSATGVGSSAGADGRGTTRDLVALMSAWRRPRLVDHTTLERATQPHLAHLDGVLPGYGRQAPNLWGLGPEIRGTKTPHWSSRGNAPTTFGHFGRAGTLWWIDPAADRGVIALTDEPFGPWSIEAWPVLADAVLSA